MRRQPWQLQIMDIGIPQLVLIQLILMATAMIEAPMGSICVVKRRPCANVERPCTHPPLQLSTAC